MDTKLIQQYGEDILCYRLRTARQKKRIQYEDFHKQLIRLYKEEVKLMEKERALGWEPLVPPVQNGWKRFFVLREDVARSKHADFFNSILKKINTHDWSSRKDFKVKNRRKSRERYTVKRQKLLEPMDHHFLKLNFTEREKQLFHEEFHYDKYRRSYYKKYVFNEPWRFVLKIDPNMITKIRKIDPAIESRLDQIDNYLEKRNLRIVQTKLLYGDKRWTYWKLKWDGREWERNPLKNKNIQQILDAVENDR